MIPPQSVGVQCATGEVWRNNSRKNEVAGPGQKRRSAADVSGGDGKAQCGKEQYSCMFMCILYMCACLYDYMYFVCIYVHVCIRLYMCIYVFWGRIAVYHSDYPATLHSFSSEVFQDCDTRGRLINPAKCGEGKTWGSLTANSRESRLNLRGEGTF